MGGECFERSRTCSWLSPCVGLVTPSVAEPGNLPLACCRCMAKSDTPDRWPVSEMSTTSRPAFNELGGVRWASTAEARLPMASY